MEAVLSKSSLRFALITQVFPPQSNSGAVQLRDLTREFARQGHQITAILPDDDLSQTWRLDEMDGVRVLRLNSPRTRDTNYIRRTIGEFLMPFVMWYNFRRSPLAKEKWDGVMWYAPSIFHGFFANSLKKSSQCKGYLIIRDIFPEWAVDVGLMRAKGLPHRFFKAMANYQYSVADIIGVQSPGNMTYFDRWITKSGRRLEVLQNWLDKPATNRSSIRLSETKLVNRTVLVYAGNMGIAQGMGILLDLAEVLSDRSDLGFLFVGRGSEAIPLRNDAERRRLPNVVFFDEIPSDEIPDLYSQCHIGLVALDARHNSHNIPGKFLTYMQGGLPVLANVNKGNDLANLIRSEQVGQVCESNNVDELRELTLNLLDEIQTDTDISKRCKRLFECEFSVDQSVRQIVKALTEV